MTDFQDDAATPAQKPRKVEIRNSLWCVHRTLGLGMVGEVGAVTTFHVEGAKGLGAAQNVQLPDLRPALASELPERLGYTPQQLEELGYL